MKKLLIALAMFATFSHAENRELEPAHLIVSYISEGRLICKYDDGTTLYTTPNRRCPLIRIIKY
ncbi:hypothetical protein OQJ65_17125 [Vibrio sp. Sgm 22]|uniref:hypothetical protein n=1 Tax=unclassified Vibrio TaxID=2614977 RepID=UPI002248AF64|nr:MULTISPECIES: hypothetical protein [unclassified Vibrio]MCX2760058.1 hypothetical protein [Vibrio sp. 14G-20]MCX2777046.1 hypothetical protein [Vibrio sp. Sgm 22]